MSEFNKYGRYTREPNLQNMPGTPAHAAEWAIECGEDPYKAAYLRLLEMMAESNNKKEKL
jgi:hypothetical protein